MYFYVDIHFIEYIIKFPKYMHTKNMFVQPHKILLLTIINNGQRINCITTKFC